MLNCRTLTADDLRGALAICPETMGHEFVGAVRAMAAWRQLVTARSFAGSVIELDVPAAGSRLVAMGAAVFVDRRFAEQELADPRPGMNARIVASIDAGAPVILSDAQLEQGNSTEGLDLVILGAAWRPGILDAAAFSEIESMLAAAFFRLFAGWRLRRMLREGTDRFAITHIRSQRVFILHDRYERFRAQHPGTKWNRDRALFVSTRDQASAFPGSVASMLFGYHEPVLRLTEYDRELLTAALAGLTDQQLAHTLNLKLPTVKKRWMTIFHHVALAQPALLPTRESPIASHSRGPQKRHYLLEYLRAHPEELRPFSRAPARQRRAPPCFEDPAERGGRRRIGATVA
jgi:hypothetical protein